MTGMPEHVAAAPSSPYYMPEHEAFRDTVRRFMAREIEPFATEWDEAGEFPRELYKKAAAVGGLQLGFPEAYGGIPCDRFYRLIWAQELAWAGADGTSASLNSHTTGFIRGCKVERIYREVKVNAIGGGAEEIMKDLAARQMGW